MQVVEILRDWTVQERDKNNSIFSVLLSIKQEAPN